MRVQQFVALIVLAATFAADARAYVIPDNDRVDWTRAGLLETPPTVADTVFQVTLMPGSTTDEKLQNALVAAKDWTSTHPSGWVIILFPRGTHELHQEIVLDHTYRNIVFQGEGTDGEYSTTLEFSFGGTNQNCFSIVGSEEPESKRYLAADLEKGSTQIHCATEIGYQTPCWIRLCEEDHPYHEPDSSWARGCVGQITRLESASLCDGELKDPASKTYTVDWNTSIWPVHPVMNIGIENLTIRRADTGHPGGGDIGINILFQFAVNCWVRGVRFEQTCKHHVVVKFSSHVHLSGNYFHDARYFGAGGYGYGVMLTHSTTNCLVENNIFHRLRHAMLLQAGANCNVVTFNYSYEQYWTRSVAGIELPVNYPSQATRFLLATAPVVT